MPSNPRRNREKDALERCVRRDWTCSRKFIRVLLVHGYLIRIICIFRERGNGGGATLSLFAGFNENLWGWGSFGRKFHADILGYAEGVMENGASFLFLYFSPIPPPLSNEFLTENISETFEKVRSR